MVTIKLNHALPSTLLRRLTSYASHHPLYQALGKLDRIVRTTFLLQYMHQEEIRRRVNHQLTKVENMHCSGSPAVGGRTKPGQKRTNPVCK
ncbi:hypothetical protein GCM10007390_47720 [Persicitalea jodogahamensis]|uniref:Tn3 transposase DDE domain-containing protein n=1 Tax=Persicitalea jodogahamensis TaxID=402147 RepID=A0A8J3GC78_9BACT|nr:hypothetical protein GCM10007390_47720 [Persicitalea jodogahamensis]